MSIITAPFSWLLLKLYELSGNYGLAVILFALVVKLILLPFQMKSKKSTMRVTRFTPRLKELEKKYEGNKEKYQEAVAKLYKEEKISPLSGCIWSLIPFPILIALYSVIRQPLTKMMGLAAEQVTLIQEKLVSLGVYEIPAKVDAYHEITLAELIHQYYDQIKAIVPKVLDIDYGFLGLDLGVKPQWNFFLKVDWGNAAEWLPALGLFLIPIISAFLSYLSMKISAKATPQTPDQQANTQSMMLTMPLISLWIGFVMPAALGIYWICSNVFSIIQEVILIRHYNRILDVEEAERLEREKAREAEIERKRQETERLRAQGATTRNPNTSKRKIQAKQKAIEEARQAAKKEKKDNGVLPSKVGDRPYARGRAYDPDRFKKHAQADAEAEETAQAESKVIPPAMDSEINATGSTPEPVNPAGFEDGSNNGADHTESYQDENSNDL
ncbi:MAG: membrane protein insertase YidC [Oscillospiraceae bacterium]|jgi:YidC/Oxa1 family membrane protein insertase